MEKSEFFRGKKKVVQKYIFEKSSRMIALTFSVDAKSTSRNLFSF